ncbi:MAG TPA: TetR/AcrR family transcriptional regulator [Acidimicrobiales bacterium]|nr:TetR/AcrR family transcriptional regulator [Acidimicrobiales bacterium]
MVRTLLDATAQVLTEVGIEKLSTNKVARRANVAVGSIYQYFSNKDALVDALVEDRMLRLGDLVRTRMGALESQTFPAAAEAMLRAGIDFLADEPGLAPVLLSHAFFASDKAVTSRLRIEAQTLARAFLERLDGPVLPKLDIAAFVSTNVAGLFGILLADPGIDDERREEIIMEVVRMLWSWMSTTP